MTRKDKSAKSRGRRTAKPEEANASPRKHDDATGDRLPTSPALFGNSEIDRVASSLPIWEASNILTQKSHLPWLDDPNGKLRYARDIGNGAIHFWVTENLEDESPVALAGAAALAVIEAFDIRAACMHLIYAAHAARLEQPWEQEMIIDDRQIESYLGLKKRTDKTRQEKLALIGEIAKQPCKITTFISHPTQGRVKGFTVEEGRLWHLLSTRYHYQHNLVGQNELVGMTFTVKPGQWTRYFLNEEGCRAQRGYLHRALLEGVMSVWQQREGVARLMVWLLFKTQIDGDTWLSVRTLLEIAYGAKRLQEAQQQPELRKKLVGLWDEDLCVLHEKGWTIEFDEQSYPLELRPRKLGRQANQRQRGYFEHLQAAAIRIIFPDILLKTAAQDVADDPTTPAQEPQPTVIPVPRITGEDVKVRRQQKGWSQRHLAIVTGISQGLISLIETGIRPVSWDTAQILEKALTDTPANPEPKCQETTTDYKDPLAPHPLQPQNYTW